MMSSNRNPISMGFQDPPIPISNNKLISMMKILTQLVTYQQEDDKMLMKV